MINIAQLGCGYWGPNLIRNFYANQDCTFETVVELDELRRKFVESNFPGIHTTDSADSVISDNSIDAVVIATPAHTHFALAKAALNAGKHIFVEKPLATSLKHIDELDLIACANGLTVMVGHTFIYNEAVRYIKSMIDEGSIGELRSIYCQRLNLGRVRSDIDAWWNFAPHDVSIIQYWLNHLEPETVTRTGMDFIQSGIDDVVFASLSYPNKVIANIHVSWLDPAKVRKIVVVGSEKMVVYDDTADNKVTIFDKGIDIKAALGNKMDFDNPRAQDISYRSGDIFIPKISFREPLKTEVAHFIECITSRITPDTGIEHARNVVSILSRADNSENE